MMAMYRVFNHRTGECAEGENFRSIYGFAMWMVKDAYEFDRKPLAVTIIRADANGQCSAKYLVRSRQWVYNGKCIAWDIEVKDLFSGNRSAVRQLGWG